MQITYGNLEGQYFTQWRIDHLNEMVRDCIAPRLPDIETYHVYYDAHHDFHCCEFEHDGRKVHIKFYKVLSYKIDGVDGWVGCPKYLRDDFAGSIKDALMGKVAIPAVSHSTHA